MTDVKRARQFKSRLHFARLERLESREVLSADMGFGHLPPAGHADDVAPTRGIQHFEISIIGTQVSYSPAGLPSDMKGTVYLETTSGTSTASIGTYDETLQPILMPVGPNGALTFVGATGVCTFDFDLSLGSLRPAVTLGSITAADTALIQGVRADGTILVGSNNAPITASTGISRGLTGTFNGQSEVIMGATFRMHTIVDFTVTNSRGVNMEEMLNRLAMDNNAVGQGDVVHTPTGDDDGASYFSLSEGDRPADRYAAVDKVFACETDQGWGKHHRS